MAPVLGATLKGDPSGGGDGHCPAQQRGKEKNRLISKYIKLIIADVGVGGGIPPAHLCLTLTHTFWRFSSKANLLRDA